MLRIAILNCDFIKKEFAEAYGQYPEMFRHIIKKSGLTSKDSNIKYKKGTVINPPPIPNKPATNPTGIAVKTINKI